MKIQIPDLKPEQKHVIIVGGGFAGLNAAKALANHSDVVVSLIDQRNHHLFQPLLYQVATAGLNPADIAVPIRSQFSHASNIHVHLGKVGSINLTERWIRGDRTEIELSYDYLILACGAQHSYFGKPEWEEFAPGLKTLEQATEIRRRILMAFELAENEFDPKVQEALMTFAVIGGGPTGVELAGAIADISRTVLIKDFRRINPASAKIMIVEAGPRVLASFSEDLSAKAESDLRALGVDVKTGTRVTQIDSNGIQAGDFSLATRNIFWAAGVQASRLHFEQSVEVDRAGRVKVAKDFSIPNFPSAFVVGDMASYQIAENNLLPGLAPVAIQSGKHVAHNILRLASGTSSEDFHYFDKGQMATIGKHRAVVSTGKLKLTGYLAWVAWLFVHIFYLIGFKNRISVFAQWTWSYLFSLRGSRLITEKEWKLKS